jgi:ABC1 atypical kinase-like domain
MEKYKLLHIYTDGVNAVTGAAEKNGQKFIFKHSGNYASCILHEYNILKSLNTLGLPNFPKVVDFIRLETSDLLIMEFIEGQCLATFQDTELKRHMIMIILLVIEYARRKIGFVHYDLHTGNVIIKKVPTKTVYKFRFDKKDYAIQSRGLCPVLIDFGCSYADTMIGKPVSFRLDNIKDGCMFVYDKTVDPLRIAHTRRFFEDNNVMDKLFPKRNNVFHLPRKVHRRLWEEFVGTELDNTIDVSYRVLEILMRLVEFPFKDYGIKELPDLKLLAKYLRKFKRCERRKILYKLVNKFDQTNKYPFQFDIPKELLPTLTELGKYLSTICKNMFDANTEYIKRIYKKFVITSPLELYQFCTS